MYVSSARVALTWIPQIQAVDINGWRGQGRANSGVLAASKRGSSVTNYCQGEHEASVARSSDGSREARNPYFSVKSPTFKWWQLIQFFKKRKHYADQIMYICWPNLAQGYQCATSVLYSQLKNRTQVIYHTQKATFPRGFSVKIFVSWSHQNSQSPSTVPAPIFSNKSRYKLPPTFNHER